MKILALRFNFTAILLFFESFNDLYHTINLEKHLLPCNRIGLDLINGKPRDNRQAGVYEPTMVKTKSLKMATEAAITILRIDDLVKSFPEQQESGPSYRDAVQSGSLEG